MISKILHSFCLLLIISFLCSCSSSKRLAKDLSKQLNSTEFSQSFTGFALYDIDRKEFIIEQNSNRYFTPASNVKLLTYYASLKELEDSIPGIRYYTTADSLIFWGTGDPSFLNTNLPSSKSFDFLKNSSKDLYFAARSANISPLGSGWAWDDYNDAYSAERSPFPIYGNVVNFKSNLIDSKPVSSPPYFSEALSIDQNLPISIRRDLDTNNFRYNNTLKKDGFEKNIPFKTSSQLTSELLSDTLGKPVTLLKKPLSPHNKDFKTIYSVAADSLYKEMLQESDNFIAEQLLLLISEKLTDTLDTNIAIEHIQSTYFHDSPDKIKWVDGSGLSRYNLITPRTLVFILDKIYKEVPKEKLFKLLPAGGMNGTIKDWYTSEDPYVFAKTGSLRNNHALSGYLITKSGKTMIFSFMNNNYVNPTSEIKKAMEKILIKIRNTY